MRLVIDVDRQYKKLFVEIAKVTGAKMRVNELYVIEVEKDETEFLLRNPKNKSRLAEAIENVEEGKVVEVEMDAYLSKLENTSSEKT